MHAHHEGSSSGPHAGIAACTGNNRSFAALCVMSLRGVCAVKEEKVTSLVTDDGSFPVHNGWVVRATGTLVHPAGGGEDTAGGGVNKY